MAIAFDGSGSASTTAAITALTTATSVYGKHMRDVAALAGIGSGLSWTICAGDDNVSVQKFEVWVLAGGSVGGNNSFQIQLNVAGQSSVSTFPTFNILPSSGPVIFAWFATNATYGIALFTAAGSLLASATHGGGTMNNATGFFRINKVPIANAKGATLASISEGDALYTGTPFDTNFTSSSWWSAPSTGDSNIVAMYKENDAFSGTTPTTVTAQVGSQALTPTTSHYNWAGGAGNQWFGPPTGPPPHAVHVASRGAIHRSFYY